MDKVKVVKQQRLECYIFAKFIVLMMESRLFWAINSVFYEKTKTVLSQFKILKYFYRQLSKISKIIRSGVVELETVMSSINKQIKHIKINIKRVKKRSLLSVIEIFLCGQN